jgi:hypothetical protein
MNKSDDAPGLHLELERLRKENEILSMEKAHNERKAEYFVRLLSGIHALLYPERVTRADGMRFEFHSPYVHEQMQELSDRIRALPEQIQKAAIAAGRES